MFPEALNLRDEVVYLEDFEDIDPNEFAAEILLNSMDKAAGEDSRMANIGNVKKDYIIGKAWFHFKGFGKMGLID